MCEVGLLVEAGLVETERVDDIDDGLGTVLNTFVGLLGGRVGADVEVLGTEGDLLAVGLVNGAADLLEVVRVGDELVAGDDVLRGRTGVLATVVLQSRKPVECRIVLRSGTPRKSNRSTYLEDDHFE